MPVLDGEMTDIKSNAATCGLSIAAYLRTLGLQYKPKGILDNKAVNELAKVNGDLGRLGGLLKMLLTNDERLKSMGKDQVMPKINDLLDQIQSAQGLLLEAAKKV